MRAFPPWRARVSPLHAGAAVLLTAAALLSGGGSREANTVSANANDNFENAQNIAPAALPFSANQDLAKATRQPPHEPTTKTNQCTHTWRLSYDVTQTVWFAYTPPEAQRLVAHTFGSGDTILAVFRAGDPDRLENLRPVTCNDNAQRRTASKPDFEQTHSQVVFEAAAGTKYYFQVGIGRLTSNTTLAFHLGVLQNAALFVMGHDSFPADRAHLEQALRKSPMWSHAVISHLEFPTDVELQNAIAETYAGVPDAGVSLFVYTGHGGRRERDDAPADEDNAPNDRQDELIVSSTRVNGRITDDRLGELFQGVPGRKVLIFDSCFSGGLVDGTRDFRGPGRMVDGVFLLSAQATEFAYYDKDAGRWGPATGRHKHWLFTGSLITGLSAGAGGVARADGARPDGVDAQADGQITVNEWFIFAQRLVRALIADHNVRFPLEPAAQNPFLDESRAPAGGRAADVVLFSYTPNQTPLLDHPGPLDPQPRQERFDNRLQTSPDTTSDLKQCDDFCCDDFGDAPDPLVSSPGQYPTRKENDGARHLNAPENGCPTCGLFTFEWLGSQIDGEDDADPERPDDDEDGDDDPGDAFDDGIEFERVSPSLIRLRATVSVFDPQVLGLDGQPRYDSSNPRKRLYLNGWADWNGDGMWLADEQIVGAGAGTFGIDPRQDPQFAPDGVATYTFDVPLPSSVLTREFYFRFRLDYGEDVGEVDRIDATLDREQGTAQFGEVEDYCDVLGLVPVFGGNSPPVSASAGRLMLNSKLATNKSFQWRSSDSILGTIESSLVSATTWNYRPGSGTEPARLVFVGRFSTVTIQANVLFEPYNRAVVDVVRGSQRVRYLLILTECGSKVSPGKVPSPSETTGVLSVQR